MMKWKKKKLSEFCEFSNGLWTGKKPPFQTVGVIRNTNFTKDCLLDDSDIVYLEVEQSQFQKRKLQSMMNSKQSSFLITPYGFIDYQNIDRSFIQKNAPRKIYMPFFNNINN